MMNDPVHDRSEAEIMERFRLAGISLPAERAEAAIMSAQRYLNAQHWLRGPRTAAVEPSNIFSPITRGASQ